jgi:hypothetical protein
MGGVLGISTGAISNLTVYFADPWHLVDCAQIFWAVALQVTFWSGTSILNFRLALGASLYLKWIGLLYFMQVLPSLGALVRMIIRITYDTRNFMFIMVIMLLGVISLLRSGHIIIFLLFIILLLGVISYPDLISILI